MGRECHDPTRAVHSSIALLQERFRQLQRVKERREERELLRILSEPFYNKKQRLSNLNNPTMNYEPWRSDFHSGMVFSQRSSSPNAPQVSLPLRPTLQLQSSAFEADQYYCSSIDQTSLLMKLWPLDTPSSLEASSDKSQLESDPYECSDVDTSLHL